MNQATTILKCPDVDEAGPINVGSGCEVWIRDLAEAIAHGVGFRGRLTFDASRHDGTPRKLLDSSRLRRPGWAPRVDLRDGIDRTLPWHEAQRTGSGEAVASRS